MLPRMTHDDRRFRGAWSARRIFALVVWVNYLAACGFGLLIGGGLFAMGAAAWLGDDPGKVYMVSGGIVLLLSTAGLVFTRRLVNRTIRDMSLWKRLWR